MIKTQFKNQIEFDTYLVEQKTNMEKGYLTVSERTQLKKMLEKDYKPIFIKEVSEKLPIISDINQLRKPCQEVTKEDNIEEIIKKLKDTLINNGGLGLTANQIDIQKKISYIRVPKIEGKQLKFTEYILINARIIEKDKPIQVKNEQCLSFPGVYVNTRRFIYCTVEYYDANLVPHTVAVQDLDSLVIQHETDHQNSIVLFDNRWRTK